MKIWIRSIIVLISLILIGIESTDASEIKFETDKQLYFVGEPVNFTLTNIGSDTIMLPSTSPWYIEDDGYNFVFGPVGLTIIIDVLPGQSKEWSWNQKNGDDIQVIPGYYYTVLNWYDTTWTFQQNYSRFFIGNVSIVHGKVNCGGIGKYGALVSLNLGQIITDELGYYSIQVPAGTYLISAQKEPECYSNNTVVYVPEGSIVEKDIELALKATGNISGMIRN